MKDIHEEIEDVLTLERNYHEANKLLKSKLYNLGFSDWRIDSIIEGAREKIDYKIYFNPNYSSSRMDCIRKGLLQKIDISLYNKDEYSDELVEKIFDILRKDRDYINQEPIQELTYEEKINKINLLIIES